MNRKTRKIAALCLAAALFALAGCTAAGDAEMSSDVWGYVASEKSAQLEVDESQPGVNALIVDRVLAPGDAWLVVHADDNGAPGMRVGLEHINEGESTNVSVALDEAPTPNVIIAVHADRGEANEFEFDMMNKEMSPDRPYFVNERELAAVVKVK